MLKGHDKHQYKPQGTFLRRLIDEDGNVWHGFQTQNEKIKGETQWYCINGKAYCDRICVWQPVGDTKLQQVLAGFRRRKTASISDKDTYKRLEACGIMKLVANGDYVYTLKGWGFYFLLLLKCPEFLLKKYAGWDRAMEEENKPYREALERAFRNEDKIPGQKSQ